MLSKSKRIPVSGLSFDNSRCESVRFPVHAGLLSSKEIDNYAALISDIDHDFSVIRVNISPRVHLNVGAVYNNFARIC